MNRIVLFIILSVCSMQHLSAQSPSSLLAAAYKNFKSLKDYAADVKMEFDIPSVRIKSVEGKVFFKQPNRFRIKTNGIVFLPKQNPYYAISFLGDTTGYTAVATGTEKIGNTICSVVTVLPVKDGDIILGKFWIDPIRSLVIRTQFTTRSNGTIQMDNTYGPQTKYPLPDKILFTVDMTKFKVPKAISVEINAKTAANNNYNQKGIGHITLTFTAYKVNQKLPDTVFTEQNQ